MAGQGVDLSNVHSLILSFDIGGTAVPKATFSEHLSYTIHFIGWAVLRPARVFTTYLVPSTVST